MPQVRRLAVAALPNVDDPEFQRGELERMAHDQEPDGAQRSACASSASCSRPPTAGRCWQRCLTPSTTCGSPRSTRWAVRARSRTRWSQALRRTIETGPPVSRVARRVACLGTRVRTRWSRMARIDPAWRTELAASRQQASGLASAHVRGPGAPRQRGTRRSSPAWRSMKSATCAKSRSRDSPPRWATCPTSCSCARWRSKDYHVVLAAARALRGATVGIRSSQRLSRRARPDRRAKNARPRATRGWNLLARVREIGNSESVGRLRPLLER